MNESYEEKWAGEKDADEYKKLTAEKRREAMLFKMLKACASGMFKLKWRQMSAIESTGYMS